MLAPLLPDLRPPLTFSHSLLFSHPQLFSSAADSLQGGPALPLPLLLKPQPARFSSGRSPNRDRYVAGEENPEVSKHERLFQYPFMDEGPGEGPRLHSLFSLWFPVCREPGHCAAYYTVKPARAQRRTAAILSPRSGGEHPSARGPLLLFLLEPGPGGFGQRSLQTRPAALGQLHGRWGGTG